MAAQLNAAAGESLYLGPPQLTEPQEGKEDETSKTASSTNRPGRGLISSS